MITKSPNALSPATRWPANWVIVSGSSSSDEAKIGGITPAVLSFSGRWLRSAWTPRAVWRLGYWIRMRRWARSMKQMNSTSATTATMIAASDSGLTVPVRPPSNSWTSVRGRCATMPAMMISEMPLPTPRLVICSPIHIRNIVPPISEMIAVTRNSMPGSTTAPPASKPVAMK